MVEQQVEHEALGLLVLSSAARCLLQVLLSQTAEHSAAVVVVDQVVEVNPGVEVEDLVEVVDHVEDLVVENRFRPYLAAEVETFQ